MMLHQSCAAEGPPKGAGPYCRATRYDRGIKENNTQTFKGKILKVSAREFSK